MRRIRQSVCLWPFAGARVPLGTFCSEVRSLGYLGLELVPEADWNAVRKAGLEIITHAAHGSLTDGLNRPENHARIESEIRASVDKAASRNIPVLICFSGNREGISESEGLANTADGLKRVARYAEERKVTLALELLNSRIDHPDYQCDRTAWGVEVVKKVGSPRVKLLYDIYHMQVMEGDLIRNIRDNIEFIGHFHTAGNPGRSDIGPGQEINYPAVMRAIAATSYAGFVGQEFIPRGDYLSALKEAFGLCDV
jgi:hydroxypyruvate isomerase